MLVTKSLIYSVNMNIRPSLPHHFQQLRWKLTLSYTGVTVGVLVTLELILLGILGIGLLFLVNSGTLPKQLIELGAQYTPAVSTHLAQSPPDQEGIAESLEWINAMTIPTLPLSFDATDDIFVIGADGTLLGATSLDLLGDDLIGQRFEPETIPGSEGPLQAALSGTEDIEQLYAVENPREYVVMAIPVWDDDHQQVLGAVIAVTEAPTIWSLIRELIPVLGVSLLVFTVIAGLIGIPFGYLAARGLVHRVEHLEDATLDWSQGDFSVVVDDQSEDELGQLAHHLNDMAEQLQSLLDTRRKLAIVEERNRLARDLHDSVKQQAFAASAQLDAVQALIENDPTSATKHVTEAVRLVDDLRQELTDLIQELRPVVLQGKGLSLALKDYATDWARQNDMTPEIRIQGERYLPLETEESLYRISQEALSNIARHSQARRVDILLTYNPNTVTLTIEDDGQGFDATETEPGLGLRSMRERAESLGGQFFVESKPNQGTQLKCVVPVEPSREADMENLHE